MFTAAACRNVKVSVSTLAVADYLGLNPVKRGKHHWVVCPFHKEKTPSMVIYPGMRGYFCFGCGKSGDTVDLYAHVRSISMGEAAKELAEVFDKDMKAFKGKPVDFQGLSYSRKLKEERLELDRLVKKYRRAESFIKRFKIGDDLPDIFWDAVQVRANLEMKIDELIYR